MTINVCSVNIICQVVIIEKWKGRGEGERDRHRETERETDRETERERGEQLTNHLVLASTDVRDWRSRF